MKSRLTIGITVLLCGLLLEFGCDLPHQPGPMPTEIIATQFTPGLNILGVLRLDDSTGTSFLYIERAYSPEEYDLYTDTLPIVKNAFATVKEDAANAPEYIFIYQAEASDHKYVNPHFLPAAGKTYILSITAPNLPQLTATTKVPVPPQVDTSTIRLSNSELQFELSTSPDAHLYEIYLLGTYGRIAERVNRTGVGKLNITLAVPHYLGVVQELQVLAYDLNLTLLMNASSSIMPQSFLETISTVNGGYGCFGAVAVWRYRWH